MQMTKWRHEATADPVGRFDIRHSDFFRHLNLDIRHSACSVSPCLGGAILGELAMRAPPASWSSFVECGGEVGPFWIDFVRQAEFATAVVRRDLDQHAAGFRQVRGDAPGENEAARAIQFQILTDVIDLLPRRKTYERERPSNAGSVCKRTIVSSGTTVRNIDLHQYLWVEPRVEGSRRRGGIATSRDNRRGGGLIHLVRLPCSRNRAAAGAGAGVPTPVTGTRYGLRRHSTTAKTHKLASMCVDGSGTEVTVIDKTPSESCVV